MLTVLVYLDDAGTHSVALTVSGTVWVWGNNQFGQIGLGDEPKRLRPAVLPGTYACAGEAWQRGQAKSLTVGGVNPSH